MSEEINQLDETKNSVERLVSYDTKGLARDTELGQTFSFERAISPASKVIGVFKRIPLANLSELPNTQLKTLQSSADAFYNVLDKVHEFDPADPAQTTAQRDEIINSIREQHQTVFTKIFPLISYLTVRSTDFSGLEQEARAAVQQAKDEANLAKEEVASLAEQAEASMETIRRTAAEQGVSQQAIHFKTEADKHDAAAKRWAQNTVWVALALGAYSILSIFLHKWDWLTPTNTYEAIQLGLSKAFIFGAISFMLILSSRNFLAHKHNAVVSRHRQNALMTFKALVDAAKIDEKQDIVLTHAAESIFSGRETSFARGGPNNANSSGAVIQMLPRTLSASATPEG